MSQVSWAEAPKCRDLFVLKTSPWQILEPEAQLLEWEARANIPEMQKPTAPVEVRFSIVREEQVETVKLEGADLVKTGVLSYFEHGYEIAWPHHPLNTDKATPFFSAATSWTQPMHYSASRSLFFYSKGALFSLKTPTNTPHPHGRIEPSKAQLNERAELSVMRSQWIKDRDEQLGPSPYLRVLYDVAAYLEKSTGNGVVLRDLRPLQDGHYYLPGFSLPFVGEKIFLQLKEQGRVEGSSRDFWAVHYGAAVGRAKAELLLRYGLLMNTPNAQNILVQLDAHLMPTGKIFFRDIGDSKYFENVAIPLGLSEFIRRDIERGVHPRSLLNIQTENSFWRMSQAGLDPLVIATWELRHDQAFTELIVKKLALDPQKYPNLDSLQGFFATDRAREILSSCCR